MANQEGTTGATPATTEVVPSAQEPAAPEPKLEAPQKAPSEPTPEPKPEPRAQPAKPLDAPPELPVSFRGYERKSTDDFLRNLEESFHNLSAERDTLRTRIEELEDEVAHYRSRSQAVADALISAQTLAAEIRSNAQHRVESQLHEAESVKNSALVEAAEVRARAEREAADKEREAQARADRLFDDAQRGIREQQHEAEHILDSAKERLGALVSDLLGKVPAHGEPSSPDG